MGYEPLKKLTLRCTFGCTQPYKAVTSIQTNKQARRQISLLISLRVTPIIMCFQWLEQELLQKIKLALVC